MARDCIQEWTPRKHVLQWHSTMSPKMLASSSMIMVRTHMITLREKQFPTLITYSFCISTPKFEVLNDYLLTFLNHSPILFNNQNNSRHLNMTFSTIRPHALWERTKLHDEVVVLPCERYCVLWYIWGQGTIAIKQANKSHTTMSRQLTLCKNFNAF